MDLDERRQGIRLRPQRVGPGEQVHGIEFGEIDEVVGAGRGREVRLLDDRLPRPWRRDRRTEYGRAFRPAEQFAPCVDQHVEKGRIDVVGVNLISGQEQLLRPLRRVGTSGLENVVERGRSIDLAAMWLAAGCVCEFHRVGRGGRQQECGSGETAVGDRAQSARVRQNPDRVEPLVQRVADGEREMERILIDHVRDQDPGGERRRDQCDVKIGAEGDGLDQRRRRHRGRRIELVGGQFDVERLVRAVARRADEQPRFERKPARNPHRDRGRLDAAQQRPRENRGQRAKADAVQRLPGHGRNPRCCVRSARTADAGSKSNAVKKALRK